MQFCRVEFVRGPGWEFDLVHATLVLHHLDDEAKAGFLYSLRRRVRDDGAFVWADFFRDPGESRADFVARYSARIRGSWQAISDEGREEIVTHMSTYDYPADRSAIVDVARQAGWQWRWLWQGSHRAEAVALLTPV